MSNHDNHRRNEEKRTEHGPSYENANPGAGCNSTHVAKSRRDWKKMYARAVRRTGEHWRKFMGGIRVPPSGNSDDSDEDK